MNSRTIVSVCLALVLASLAVAQTGNNKQFAKEGLTFDYPAGWTLQENTDSDAQKLALGKANSDVQISLFVHKGRITSEKFPDAKKAFIDPYVAATAKQFVAMGAKPEEANDSTEIAGEKAEGVAITASLGGEPGAAKIYWALIGKRVVVLTYFGPDKELKQFASAWDTIRNSLKVEDPKAEAKPSPTP